MRELHRIDEVNKKAVKEAVREVLKKHEEILFAYLHGSFVKKMPSMTLM